MAPAAPKGRPYTVGSSTFDPDAFLARWNASTSPPQNNDLRGCILTHFGIPATDNYVYHAVASVTLKQVQSAIEAGASHGLHTWYLDAEGAPAPPPPRADVDAYTALFAPTAAPAKALMALGANAKKSSLRAATGARLVAQRVLPAEGYTFARSKAHVNPYYDVWTWSCAALEWGGPVPETEHVKHSHPVLPVLMHHFGCVVPSYEALMIVKRAAEDRAVVDMGSGNGYWTYMLRRAGVQVTPVDSAESSWRTLWVGDTVIVEGEKWLKREKGAKDRVLLMVYPVVKDEFTKRLLDAYEGSTVVVAGTQNRNGYTGFVGQTMGEWMDERGGWEKTVQVPLPSFAGKDEALFVFQRKETVS